MIINDCVQSDRGRSAAATVIGRVGGGGGGRFRLKPIFKSI